MERATDQLIREYWAQPMVKLGQKEFGSRSYAADGGSIGLFSCRWSNA
jgi:hypothetical protein